MAASIAASAMEPLSPPGASFASFAFDPSDACVLSLMLPTNFAAASTAAALATVPAAASAELTEETAEGTPAVAVAAEPETDADTVDATAAAETLADAPAAPNACDIVSRAECERDSVVP